jgi:hypothetical protein
MLECSHFRGACFARELRIQLCSGTRQARVRGSDGEPGFEGEQLLRLCHAA